MASTTGAQDASWLKLSDEAFAQQYAKQATGSSLADQSTVAWMLFARLNQPEAFNGKNFSRWELWPSNDDTFSPAAPTFLAANKVRSRPHLQEPKAIRVGAKVRGSFDLPPTGGGEEVTRNAISYGYITKNRMRTAIGVWRHLNSSQNLDFPIGATEIKAFWSVGETNGAYQVTDTTETPPVIYSLLGLHIMAKVAPTPGDPFFGTGPSWFWTTFEFKENPGLTNAQRFLTYHDALTRAQSLALLNQAGLGSGPFANYVCNGTQIQYSDAKHPSIVLGNTTMENFSFEPSDATSPAQWTSWKVSCHSCHGTGSASGPGKRPPGNLLWNQYFTANDVVGPLTQSMVDGYKSFDFVWSFFRAR